MSQSFTAVKPVGPILHVTRLLHHSELEAFSSLNSCSIPYKSCIYTQTLWDGCVKFSHYVSRTLHRLSDMLGWICHYCLMLKLNENSPKYWGMRNAHYIHVHCIDSPAYGGGYASFSGHLLYSQDSAQNLILPIHWDGHVRGVQHRLPDVTGWQCHQILALAPRCALSIALGRAHCLCVRCIDSPMYWGRYAFIVWR